MARVTVEDCIEVVANRFELVAYASQRARDIASGSPITIDRDNDKDSVVSLREIAKGTVGVEKLKEAFIQSFQKRSEIDEIEEETQNSENSEAIAEELKSLEVVDIPEENIKEGEFDFGAEEVDAKD